MLYILLNWIYIFLICLGMGAILNSILRTKTGLFYTLLLGVFAEMSLIHFYAIGFPINEFFYGFNFILASFGIIFHKKILSQQIKSAISDWKTWKKPIQILGILLTILILMQSATQPFIVDNETYYIQTLKWLNEFGLVKGLANLHIFFGQMSGWHLLQSGFNFGFLSNSLNDVNGFLMLIFTGFSLYHLNRFFQTRITMDLFLGLIPVGNLFLFQFLSAPSPDLPVFLISQLIFYLFYRNYVEYQGDFKMLFILTLLLILTKITVVPLLILPLVLIIRHKIFKAEWKYIFGISLIALSGFLLKNYIISGYLFYPTEILSSFLNPDWKAAPEMLRLFFEERPEYEIIPNQLSEINRENFFQLFKNWLLEPGLRSIFNKLIIVLLLIFPLYIRKNKTLFWLYIYALVQFGLLYFTSPQYRFFMPLIIGMSLYILAKLLLNSPKKVIPVFAFFSLIVVVPLIFSFNVSNLKNSEFMPDKLEAYRIENIIKPAKNSLHNFEYELMEEGNLKYNSPIGQEEFFWITGDGDLPTVNRGMIEYFKKWYKIRPQMRGENLKEGFYAEKLKE